ncbi:MAG: tRNA (N6-isopentenyl adenosine(37)-C2)-methylthiotransferase MiaB, partial [Deltaproteobacteria bacterium]|nr:tRNA (N6-isopentenyl adenosine(37)-C2)-methylthiotransferase MiaB [Deltaproteobacteria bacterium]
MRRKAYIHTFGCQMNEYDSARMMGLLQSSGYEYAESPETADLIIVNTCSVREKAEQKVYSLLGRLKKHKMKRGTKIAV